MRLFGRASEVIGETVQCFGESDLLFLFGSGLSGVNDYDTMLDHLRAQSCPLEWI